MAETWLLAVRCPGYRWRDSGFGSGPELENLIGGDKGKGTSGSSARPKVLIRRAGADCPVVAMKRGNARGAKEAGHRRWIGSTDCWVTDSGRSPIYNGRRQPSCGDTSRMNREVQVRNL